MGSLSDLYYEVGINYSETMFDEVTHLKPPFYEKPFLRIPVPVLLGESRVDKGTPESRNVLKEILRLFGEVALMSLTKGFAERIECPD